MRGRRWWAAVLALVVAVGTAACGGDDDAGTTASIAGRDADVVPFERRPAEIPEETTDRVAGPDVPECTADVVTYEIVDPTEVLGGGGPPPGHSPEHRIVALMARPGERCAVSTWPPLGLASSEGDAGTLVADIAPPDPPPGERLLLAGRQRFLGIVRWLSNCAPAGAEVRVESRLAGGDVVSTPLPDPPACDPAAANTNAPWLSVPASIPESPLEATLVDVPAETPFDGTLRFTVALANPGDSPVALDPCPVYQLSFGESGTAVSLENELNCPAGPDEIAPGDELWFAVEMDLPGDEVPAGFSGASLFLTIHMGDGTTAHASTTDLSVSDP